MHSVKSLRRVAHVAEIDRAKQFLIDEAEATIREPEYVGCARRLLQAEVDGHRGSARDRAEFRGLTTLAE